MTSTRIRWLQFLLVLVTGVGLLVPAWGSPNPAGETSHGAHGHDAAPSLDDFNWYYGMLGEKEGVEPSFLFRPKGMPVPFGALLLNSAILYLLIFRLAKKPLLEALKKRKDGILHGMEDAARMKNEAESRLAEYEHKLARIDQEVERVRREMREAAEHERQRVLAEARDKRAKMERDARWLVDQELRAARELLMREMVEAAVSSAQSELVAQLGPSDHDRINNEYLMGLRSAAALAVRGRV